MLETNQVSSQKLLDETGFEASIELINGVNEIYDLIFHNRIKDITDPRYSNQNFLSEVWCILNLERYERGFSEDHRGNVEFFNELNLSDSKDFIQ